MKLNLGCFNKKLPGFVNVDIREDVEPDIIDNAFTLEKFDDNSANIIYACHMLEHLDYNETKKALIRWYSVLKKNGLLRLAVPDMEKCCALFLLLKDKSVIRSMFWGSQRHPFDYHKNGWDFNSLKVELEEIGFTNVHKWEWQTTEPHNYCDDYSQSYWPHMLKDYEMSNGKRLNLGGTLISLNVEATKC